MSLDKKLLDGLAYLIKECGDYAVEKQASIHVKLKEDLSPVTETDLEISRRVLEYIKKNFPECGIITEEIKTERKENAPYTFVLDPIDGTDAYSQGFPTFCVGLSILDKENIPCGAIIYAPRFGRATNDGMFVLSYPDDSTVYLNKEVLTRPKDKDEIRQITISSKLGYFNLSSFKGKARTFGSAIINALCPCIFPNIDGSIAEPCFIWDFAPSHAILMKLGMNLYTENGDILKYEESELERNRLKYSIYGGTEKGVRELLKIVPARSL